MTRVNSLSPSRCGVTRCKRNTSPRIEIRVAAHVECQITVHHHGPPAHRIPLPHCLFTQGGRDPPNACPLRHPTSAGGLSGLLDHLTESVAPGCLGDGGGAIAGKDVTGGGNGCGIDMSANQDRALLDSLLPAVRFPAVEAGLPERSGDTPSDMTGRFSQPGGQGPIRHNRTDARKYERDCGKKVGAELSQLGRPSRILDLGSRRRARGFGERAFLIMRPRHHGDSFPRNAERTQTSRSRCRRRRIIEEGENERVHRETLLRHIPVTRPHPQTGTLRHDFDRSPFAFAALDRLCRRIAEQVLVSQLPRHGRERLFQLSCVSQLKRTSTGQDREL